MNVNGGTWQTIDTAPKDDTPVDLWRPWLNGGKAYGGERCTDMCRIELAPGQTLCMQSAKRLSAREQAQCAKEKRAMSSCGTAAETVVHNV